MRSSSLTIKCQLSRAIRTEIETMTIPQVTITIKMMAMQTMRTMRTMQTMQITRTMSWMSPQSSRTMRIIATLVTNDLAKARSRQRITSTLTALSKTTVQKTTYQTCKLSMMITTIAITTTITISICTARMMGIM